MNREIKYVVGDATNPHGEGKKLIIHVSNDIGGWGAGFVIALSNKWKGPEAAYREWYSSAADMSPPGYKSSVVTLPLGMIQPVPVTDDITVINMIGQHKTSPSPSGRTPVRYGAIQLCLEKVALYAKSIGASVHAPRFGAGLAGGDWNRIESIINEELIDAGIDVTVYDFEA